MTNKVLIRIAKMITSGEIPNEVYDKYLSDCPIDFMDTDTLFNYLSQDAKLVESLKRVLSKVVRVIHQPEIEQIQTKEGFINYFMRHEYHVAPDFDVVAFKEIIDKLGYELVKKEKN